MEITIHEENISHFTFHGKKGPITSHENTLHHPLLIYDMIVVQFYLQLLFVGSVKVFLKISYKSREY